MIKRVNIFTIIILLATLCAKGGDTIRVMHYNLLYYDMNTSWCTSINNNVNDKDTYLKTITSHFKPDIFTVNEMNGRASSTDRIIDNVLNTDGDSHYQRANFTGSYLVNMLYYNSRKLALKSQSYILTSPRITDVYRLYYKSDDLTKGDTTFITCFVTHLKAGSYDENVYDRSQAASQIMNYINNYNITDNVLFMGDFNVYSSAEPAFQSFMTETASGFQFNDPINALGDWNNNYSYAPYHTQSTHTSGDCHSGGGMDDRFDFILTSQPIIEGSAGITYAKNTYWSYGQDGKRFNQTLISPTNTSLPTNVLSALYKMSDHLPVTLKLYVDKNPLLNIDTFNNPSGKIRIKNPVIQNISIWSDYEKAEQVTLTITNQLGGVVLKKLLTLYPNEQHTISAANISPGMFLIDIRGKNISFTTKLIKR